MIIATARAMVGAATDDFEGWLKNPVVVG
jgi:hypothetical protein